MTSVLNSVTGWLGGSRERDRTPPGEREKANPTEGTGNEVSPGSESVSGPTNEQNTPTTPTEDEVASQSSSIPIDVNFQEVSEKAVTVAKEWGSYLFSFGKTATEQVTKTAKQLKETVEEKSIFGDFTREQDKFIAEHRDKKKQTDTALPPWVGYNEEETMKAQILALAKDKRNFLRNPPAGVQFNFDYDANFPVAMVLLEEDPNLKEMRFNMVPREIKEEVFWRNYFYRVSLIKQSTQLTSLAQHSASKEIVSRTTPAKAEARTAEEKEMTVGSPPTLDHEFVSDAFQDGGISADELKNEMNQLGFSEKKEVEEDDVPEWERELQAELQEYEVVDDGNNIDDADLEREILSQIEAEAKQT